MRETLAVGVVGYSGQQFDEGKATAFIGQAFDAIEQRFPTREMVIVSGLTDLGIPHLAYLEACRRGYSTVGIASAKAQNYPRFPLEEKLIVGSNWGDESQTFLNRIQFLVRIGGGAQSMQELAKAKEMGLPVLEFELESIG